MGLETELLYIFLENNEDSHLKGGSEGNFIACVLQQVTLSDPAIPAGFINYYKD